MTKPSAFALQFGQQFNEVTARIRAGYNFPFIKDEFQDFTWSKFDFKVNQAALISENEPYFAYKEIVFSAFCAWLIAPGDDNLRHSLITIAVAKKMNEIEDSATEETKELRFLQELGHRIFEVGPDFFTEIYYPIGGLAALLKCSSPAEIRGLLNKKSSDVNRVIFMMRLLHYAATDLQQEGDIKLARRASKTMIIDSIIHLNDTGNLERGLSKRTAGPLWSSYERSMLLLYAADHVHIKSRPGFKGGSFIEAILTGSISYTHDIGRICEILARAGYLKSTLRRGIAQETMRILNANEIHAPKLIETERSNFNMSLKILQDAIVRAQEAS